ncbi:FimV/HubP family polar landmark protein [Chitinivorax sp. PXF-14]|uniref:FimV/HubP family polar landmark protein n=1 Tax=Chitinivorax sp. PXF-14 TaxID=3230488 RepID=UPI00346608D1
MFKLSRFSSFATLSFALATAAVAESPEQQGNSPDLAAKIQTLEQAVAEQRQALQAAEQRSAALEREMTTLRKSLSQAPVQVAPAATADTKAEKGELAPSESSAPPLAAASGEPAPQPLKALPKLVPTAAPDWSSQLPAEAWYGAAAAGAGAVLLAAGWLIRRRRAKPSVPLFEDSLLASHAPLKNVVIGSTGGAVIDTTLTMSSLLQADTQAADPMDQVSIDPVAEAEVYLAYGRDNQAEEILRDALNKMPDRQDVRLKLLEIYANRRETPAFEDVLGEMRAHGVAGDEAFWLRAMELAHTLGVATPGEAAVPVLPISPAVTEGKLETALPLETHQAPMEMVPEADLVFGEQAEPSPEVDLQLPEYEPEAVRESTQTAAEHAVPLMRPAPGRVLGGDGAFNLLLPEADGVAVQVQAGLPLAADQAPLAELEPAPVEATVLHQPSYQSIDPAKVLDFDFEFDSGESEAPMPAPFPIPEVLDRKIELDLTGIDLNLDAPLAKESPSNIAPEPVQPAEGDPIAIKIDLARAYFDMGDAESANEILDEVIESGSAEQAGMARLMRTNVSLPG